MKSKLKEVNKHLKQLHKSDNDHQIVNDLRRTMGTKPFQLHKIRGYKRNSVDAADLHTQPQHQRYKSQVKKYSPTKDVYLDLLVRKALVRHQYPQRLECPRENTLKKGRVREYENLQQLIDKESLPKELLIEEQNTQMQLDKCSHYVKEIDGENIPQIKQGKYQQRQECECGLALNEQLTEFVTPQADSNSKISNQFKKANPQIFCPRKKSQIDLHIQLKNVKDKVMSSPFAFTNIKWRTKSEVFNVDKWKQKYKQLNISPQNSNTEYKIVKKIQKQQSAKNDGKKSPPKGKLLKPIVTRQKDQKLFPSISRTLKQKDLTPFAMKVQEIIDENQKIEELSRAHSNNSNFFSFPLLNDDPILSYQQFEKEREKAQCREVINQSERGQQNKSFDKIGHTGQRQANCSSKIVCSKIHKQRNVKQAYIHQIQISLPFVEYQYIQKQSKEEQYQPKVEKQFNPKQIIDPKTQNQTNKKVHTVKFQNFKSMALLNKQTQISKDYQKEKIVQAKVMDSSPRKEKTIKKLYMPKIIQQAPARWEYGQSRQYSRQVDSYLKIKEQQQRLERQEKEQKQKQMQEQLKSIEKEDL